MAHFGYPCPDCRSTNNLHDPDCRFTGRAWTEVEKSYLDTVSVLAEAESPMAEAEVRAAAHGDWDALHAAALSRLKGGQRVRDTDAGMELLAPEEYREAVTEPQIEPIRTVYVKGSVPGAHDHSVFALVAYYEMVGLSWEETRENMIDWLHESGTWDRGGFEEESPEDLVDSKRHVFEEGYGWKQAAKEAKAVIDRTR